MRHKPALLWLEALLSLYLCFCDTGSHGPWCHTDYCCGTPATVEHPRELESSERASVREFARMTFHEAREFEGKRITVRLRVASEPMDADNMTTIYSCRSEDHLVRSVCFPNQRAPLAAKAGAEIMVDGRLETRFHNSWMINGREIPSYMELRLTDASIVKAASVESH